MYVSSFARGSDPEAVHAVYVSPSMIVDRLDTAGGDVGAGGTTFTSKDCSALPPAFVAVTVTVDSPAATAVTVTLVPATSTVATWVSEDSAVYVSPAPAKCAEAVTVCVAPSVSVAPSMLPTAVGAGGSTVTARLCSALPPAFVAVTVSVDSPAATAVTVTLVPATSTVATWVSEDSAAYVSPRPRSVPRQSRCAWRPR